MLHTIRIASRRTGLSPHVIRIWERRYGVLATERTETNRRLYCDEDLERLSLLRELTQNGHQIGMIAHLAVPKLKEIIQQENPSSPTLAPPSPAKENGRHTPATLSPLDYQQKCLQAVKEIDAGGMRELLEQAKIDLGYRTTLQHVVAPLITRVGEDWQEGTLRVAHEHLHTSVVRDFLCSTPVGSVLPPQAPELIVSTPAGGAHELGALLVSATARDLGWRVTYLGASLPAEEISAVARARSAKAIAISLVYPAGDAEVRVELLRLRSLMPQAMVLILGGRAAESYRKSLAGIPGVRWCDALDELEKMLVSLSLAG